MLPPCCVFCVFVGGEGRKEWDGWGDGTAVASIYHIYTHIIYVCVHHTAVVAAAEDAEVDELLPGEAQALHHLMLVSWGFGGDSGLVVMGELVGGICGNFGGGGVRLLVTGVGWWGNGPPPPGGVVGGVGVDIQQTSILPPFL